MALTDRDLSGNNPILTVDLVETFGEPVPEDVAQGFGQDLINEIRDRTQNKNINRFGNSFKGYTKEYVDSFIFKAFKGGNESVNLTLTGDMMGTMDLLSVTDSFLEIGWNSSNQAAKAHGHITGKNGQVPKMQRDFFGLPDTVIKQKAREYESQIEREPARSAIQELSTSRLDRALQLLLGEDE